MLQRIFAILTSAAMGLLASAAVLVLAGHPAGVAWAAPAARPLADVLTVGGACGTTIQACIDFANPGDEVHIPAGLYTESVTVDKAISITGDLSSTTIIHAVDGQRVMTFTTQTTLPVYLAAVTLTGGVYSPTAGFDPMLCGGGLRIYATGAAILQDVTITNNTSNCGGGLGIFGSGPVTLDGVDIVSNTAGVGGGILSAQAELDLVSGSVRGNVGTYLSGGIEQEYGYFTMSGGEVVNNSTDYFGGGVSVFWPGAVFTQTGGSIVSNTAARIGGGIFAQGATLWLLGGNVMSNSAPTGAGIAIYSDPGVPSALTLGGGTIAYNATIGAAGGVYLTGPATTFTQTSGSIEHNSAIVGGGLVQDAGSSVRLLGGQVFSNTAAEGAGLYVITGTLTLEGGQITANAATHWALGGGVYLNGPQAILTETAGSIESNTATQGGGIYVAAAQAWLLGGQVVSNSAASDGGGVYATSASTLTLAGGDIFSNSATNGGGVAVIGPDSMLTQTGGSIDSNSAGSFGGGIYALTGTVTLDGGDIDGNDANDGGGVFVQSGQITLSGGSIYSNTAYVGGGLANAQAQSTLAGTQIMSNSATYGGGVALDAPGAVFTQTSGTIAGNTAQLYGGGIANPGRVVLLGGKIVSNSASSGGGGIAGLSSFLPYGSVTIIGGASIAGNTAYLGGGAYIELNTLFTQTAGLIVSNTAFIGGGLYMDRAQGWLAGGQVISNSATNGGGVYALTSTVTIGGGEISGNSVANIGGGIAASSSSLVLNSGVISQNTAVALGGGLWLAYGQATLAGGTVYSNSAETGGGLAQGSGQLALTGATIEGNSADYGAGIAVQGPSETFTQTGGRIDNNTAQILGGGLAASDSWVTLSGGSIDGNQAGYGAGVLSTADSFSAHLTLAGASVESNTATGAGGGGVYVGGAQSFFTQTAGSIEHNIAITGGGIYEDQGAVWFLGGGILSNTASASAGGVFIGGSGAAAATISDSIIAGNLASAGIGGIEVDQGTLVISNSRILANTGTGAGAIGQAGGLNPVSVSVGNSCISGNGPLTSVVNAGGPTIDARGNWWGAADGPAGAGPGSGDAVSSGVDYSGFLTTPAPSCPAPAYDLTVARNGTGAGRVTSSPAGIDCGSDCSMTFDQGTVVTLTATPALSSTFTGWTGACSGTDACVITMTQPAAVTATFTLSSYSLTVGLAGNGSGSVSSLPPGIDCDAACGQAYDYGTIVTLTATPAVSGTFAGWSGACGGPDACVITMTQPAAVTATFTLSSYTLTVGLAGNGSGLVTSLPPGIDCGGACEQAHDYGTYGTVVTLTATPAIRSTFAGWTGACGGMGSCIVTMTQPAAVTATFAISSYTLTVGLAGNGNGHVTSQPPGIDCGGACDHAYEYGTVVTLTATLAMGTSFTGWSGPCAGWGWCVVPMSQTAAVTATFTLNGEMLTAAKAGTGDGTVTGVPGSIDCGAACSQVFDYGTVVSLTAEPAASSIFAGWQGACAGSAACLVTLTQPSLITATFSLKSYTLTVMLSGAGSGSVASVPAGLSCGSTCAASFAYGSALTLTVAPTAGSSFAGWSGPCAGTGPCGLVITQATTVTAEFDAQAPRFTIYLPVLAEGAAAAGAPYRKWVGGWRVLEGIVPDWR